MKKKFSSFQKIPSYLNIVILVLFDNPLAGRFTAGLRTAIRGCSGNGRAHPPSTQDPPDARLNSRSVQQPNTATSDGESWAYRPRLRFLHGRGTPVSLSVFFVASHSLSLSLSLLQGSDDALSDDEMRSAVFEKI